MGGHGGAGGSQSGPGGGGGHGGGGQGALVPSLAGMNLFIDCMPIVSPDPIHGSFDAKYDNTAGKAADFATIKSASLVMKGPNSMDTWTFTATPKQSGSVAAGAVTKVMHTKDMGSGMGTGSPCNHCNDTWTLTVAWDVAGKTVQDTAGPVQVSCVF